MTPRVYQFPRAVLTKCHKLGGLEQQKFIFSQFWRLEVQNQGAGRAVLPLEALGENLPLSFLVSGGYQQSLVFIGL